jgi:hypothetical protein
VIVALRVVTGVLLLAHGLVHLLYLAPGVREFSVDGSTLVPEPARRPVALALMATTVAAFALLALSVWGVPALSASWTVIAIVACSVSALLLVLYWNTALVLGLAIDLAVLTIALLRPGWAEQLLGRGT